MPRRPRRARFVVPGKPQGYVATTKRGKWTKEYQRFADYAKEVRFHAKAAGIKIPLVATKDRQITIRTIAYFPNGTHYDPGNVQKGVVDALFYDEEKAALAKMARAAGKRPRKGRGTGKGDDKHTGGSFPPPRYDKENPRVVVIIKDYVPKKGKKNGQKLKEQGEKRPQGKSKTARAKDAPKGESRSEESKRRPRPRAKGSKKNVQPRRTRR